MSRPTIAPAPIAIKAEQYPDLDRCAHTVIEAATEVHRQLGPGFSQSAYEDALSIELTLRGLGVERQLSIPVVYKGISVSEARIDLVVANALVVEIRAVDELLPLHSSQVVSYLKAGAYQLGLLINFNVPTLRDGIRRIVC